MMRPPPPPTPVTIRTLENRVTDEGLNGSTMLEPFHHASQQVGSKNKYIYSIRILEPYVYKWMYIPLELYRISQH